MPATRLPTAPHLQFFDGVGSVYRGARFLWRTPASWPLAAVPVALCGILCLVAIVLSVKFVPGLMAIAWPKLAEQLGPTATSVVRFVGIAATAFLGMLLATMLAPILSAPALERLVLLRERDLGVPPRAAAGFWRELGCALQAQLLAIAVMGPLVLVLWLVTLLFPAAALVTLPLQFLALAWSLAWSLLDYPLSLRGVSLRVRLSLVRRGAPAVLGFGLALAVAFGVPLLPLLLLPVAVSAAAELSAMLQDSAAASSEP